VPTLLATLDEKNIKRGQVDYIILTHIHLDHAGGAGELIKVS
jgi:glyoxylase-like metal-dependent hydrolase (beta-lactamase superfamily II)